MTKKECFLMQSFFPTVFVFVTFIMASNSGFDMYYMEQQMHPNQLYEKTK